MYPGVNKSPSHLCSMESIPSQISFPTTAWTFKADFVLRGQPQPVWETVVYRFLCKHELLSSMEGLKPKACLSALYGRVPWLLSGEYVLTHVLGPGFLFKPRKSLALCHHGPGGCSAGCGVPWCEQYPAEKNSDQIYPLCLPVCLGVFPQLTGAALKWMVILSFFTSQERPELVVSSELLVFAPEPSEERKQRPRNLEWHLPEQCDYALHADQRGFHQDV